MYIRVVFCYQTVVIKKFKQFPQSKREKTTTKKKKEILVKHQLIDKVFFF